MTETINPNESAVAHNNSTVEETLIAAAFDDIAYLAKKGFYVDPADPRVLIFTDVDEVMSIVEYYSKNRRHVYPVRREAAIKNYNDR